MTNTVIAPVQQKPVLIENLKTRESEIKYANTSNPNEEIQLQEDQALFYSGMTRDQFNPKKEHDQPYINIFDQIDINSDELIDDAEMQTMVDMMNQLEDAQEEYRAHNKEVGKVLLGEVGVIGLGTIAGATLLSGFFAPILGAAIGYIGTTIPTLFVGDKLCEDDSQACKDTKKQFLEDVDYHPYAEKHMDKFFGDFDM